MKKKLLSLALVATMVFGMSISAFAADLDDATELTTGQAVTGTSQVVEPTIKVTVPTSTKIYVNPYKIPYKVDGVFYNSQIVSVPQVIVNESDVPLAISISELKATAGSNVTLLPATDGKAPTLEDSDTGKKAFVYFSIVKGGKWDAKLNDGEGAWTGNAIPTTFSGSTCTALSSEAAAVAEPFVVDAMKKTVKEVAKKESDQAKAKEVDPKTGNYVTVTIEGDKLVTTTETPSIVTYGFGGFLNGKSATVWEEADTINPGYKFTFKILENK